LFIFASQFSYENIKKSYRYYNAFAYPSDWIAFVISVGIFIMEIWKQIKDYPNYEVSNLGRVKSIDRFIADTVGRKRYYKSKILKQVVRKGYHSVSLYNNKGIKIYRVNRIVAFAFIENINNKLFVNHIDGIKSNNKVENLEWCTCQENITHSIKNGLSKYASGEKQGHSKLKYADIIKIKELNKTHSARKISFMFNVCAQSIHNVLNNKTWK
jgi:hypothetical protein